ncbi:serine/threonine-protein kinase [Agromyces sp. LHK192]|uniref:serine/threonine-protein kinase n=1 Tax=Agromyces sp. LHK192 TaxID=2498704 RepID=UPI0013E3DE12|nr:serine/threonine-protein kinase [Agromyces sp. LHK192]
MIDARSARRLHGFDAGFDAAGFDSAAFAAAPTADGRYEASRLIGSGGMADVYLARDTVLGREVAVKVFRADHDTADDRLRREREIQLLVGFSHPGLVAVHDAGFVHDGGAARRFFVMEHVAGHALADRIRIGALKPRSVADIGAQVADALSYVHGHDVVHRDVKPENILLDETPALGYSVIAKLADFGVAQYVDSSRLTADGAIMGTAAYISPEQARGEEVGPASDVYSLGLVLLEALKGEREYSGTAIESALGRLARDPEVPEDLPEDWQELLAAMTHADPSARPTAHDVAAVMRDLVHELAAAGAGRRSRRAGRRAGARHDASARPARRFWGMKG